MQNNDRVAAGGGDLRAKSWRRAVVGVAVTLGLLTAAIWTAIDRRELLTTQLDTPSGTIVVEVAETPAARSAGLSNREGLMGVDGLLLKWDAPGRHPIWMAQMQYEPEGTANAAAVLELPAGRAANHRIEIGVTLRYSQDPQRSR